MLKRKWNMFIYPSLCLLSWWILEAQAQGCPEVCLTPLNGLGAFGTGGQPCLCSTDTQKAQVFCNCDPKLNHCFSMSNGIPYLFATENGVCKAGYTDCSCRPSSVPSPATTPPSTPSTSSSTPSPTTAPGTTLPPATTSPITSVPKGIPGSGGSSNNDTKNPSNSPGSNRGGSNTKSGGSNASNQSTGGKGLESWRIVLIAVSAFLMIVLVISIFSFWRKTNQRLEMEDENEDDAHFYHRNYKNDALSLQNPYAVTNSSSLVELRSQNNSYNNNAGNGSATIINGQNSVLSSSSAGGVGMGGAMMAAAIANQNNGLSEMSNNPHHSTLHSVESANSYYSRRRSTINSQQSILRDEIDAAAAVGDTFEVDENRNSVASIEL